MQSKCLNPTLSLQALLEIVSIKSNSCLVLEQFKNRAIKNSETVSRVGYKAQSTERRSMRQPLQILRGVTGRKEQWGSNCLERLGSIFLQRTYALGCSSFTP